MNPITIYNRFKHLKYKAITYSMNLVGRLVKDIYIEKYGKKPEKIEVTFHSLKMRVNTYPLEFLSTIDEIIHNYHKDLPKPVKSSLKSKKQPVTQKPLAAKQTIQIEPANTSVATEPGKRVRKRITVKAIPVRPTIKK